MCRWLAYTGSPLQLESVIFKAQHSLIEQSLHARMATTYCSPHTTPTTTACLPRCARCTAASTRWS